MDELIAKLKTPEECEIFEKNVLERNRPDLAVAARRRSVELRAQLYGATTDVERECIEAVFAYEQVLSAINGKKARANRTWQMIDRRGIVPAVERAVNRRDETVGYKALQDMGLEQFSFEAVITRHPNAFSPESLRIAMERITAR